MRHKLCQTMILWANWSSMNRLQVGANLAATYLAAEREKTNLAAFTFR